MVEGEDLITGVVEEEEVDQGVQERKDNKDTDRMMVLEATVQNIRMTENTQGGLKVTVVQNTMTEHLKETTDQKHRDQRVVQNYSEEMDHQEVRDHRVVQSLNVVMDHQEVIDQRVVQSLMDHQVVQNYREVIVLQSHREMKAY